MLDKENSFRQAFYHLKLAKMNFDMVALDTPNKLSGEVSKKYGKKLDWIFFDFKTDPRLPKFAQDEFERELEDDPFSLTEISRMASKLDSVGKSSLEAALKALLSGEKLTLVLNEKTNQNIQP